jgi:hypothetical protein
LARITAITGTITLTRFTIVISGGIIRFVFIILRVILKTKYTVMTALTPRTGFRTSARNVALLKAAEA